MPLTEKKLATIEDYERLPEGAPYQLIDGELITTPSPTPFHQSISRNLFHALDSFVVANRLGRVFFAPLDITLNEINVFQPDILFVRKDRVHLIGRKKFNIIPDLVIEILSESTAYHDLTKKKASYCSLGVTEYWIVDPEDEAIEIMIKDGEFYRTESLIRKQGIVHSPMFPGFSVTVEEVFEF